MKKTTFKNKFCRVLAAIFVVLTMAWFSAGLAQEVIDQEPKSEASCECTVEEVLLFDLINQARQNPMEAIDSVGMDLQKVLEDNQDIADILQEGLPPLEFSHDLYNTAQIHVADMLENNYYSYESIDGTTLADGLEKTGYIPVSSGRALGVIAFNNYVDPQKAAGWIFENMLKDELSPENTGFRKIFNPDLQQAASAMAGGTFRFDSFAANAYVAACDFATPVEVWELELINLINQFRDDPWAVLDYHGIKIDKEKFPELETLLSHGLEPLAFDLSLYKSADVLASDMFENDHFTPITSDGEKLEDRVNQAGYHDWSWLGESRGRFPTCNEIITPSQSVERIFRYLLSRAFNQDTDNRHYPMLAPWAEDCGIRIMAGQSPVLGGICGDCLHILIADFGSRLKDPVLPDEQQEGSLDQAGSAEPTGRLVGIVYLDENLNNLYDQKEGLSGSEVVLDKGKDTSILYENATNAAGGLFMELPPGRYRLKIKISTDQAGSSLTIFKWVDIYPDASVWFPVSLDSESFDPESAQVSF